jgi:hypothetical protein
MLTVLIVHVCFFCCFDLLWLLTMRSQFRLFIDVLRQVSSPVTRKNEASVIFAVEAAVSAAELQWWPCPTVKFWSPAREQSSRWFRLAARDATLHLQAMADL